MAPEGSFTHGGVCASGGCSDDSTQFFGRYAVDVMWWCLVHVGKSDSWRSVWICVFLTRFHIFLGLDMQLICLGELSCVGESGCQERGQAEKGFDVV